MYKIVFEFMFFYYIPALGYLQFYIDQYFFLLLFFIKNLFIFPTYCVQIPQEFSFFFAEFI